MKILIPLVGLLLIDTAMAAAPALLAGPTQPHSSPGPLAKIEPLVKAEGAAKDLTLERLGRFECLLTLLPMDSLHSVKVDGDWVEFGFDFGKRSSKKIKTKAGTQWVLDSKGRPKEVKLDRESLLVHKRLRIKFSGKEIDRIGKGDIEYPMTFCDLNVKIRSAITPLQDVKDGDKRRVLALDKNGRPYRKDGRWVTEAASHWVVVKVRSEEIWIPAS